MVGSSLDFMFLFLLRSRRAFLIIMYVLFCSIGTPYFSRAFFFFGKGNTLLIGLMKRDNLKKQRTNLADQEVHSGI